MNRNLLLLGISWLGLVSQARAQVADDVAQPLYNRSFDLSLPLAFQDQILGDVQVTLLPDGEVLYDSESLARALGPLIAVEARKEFVDALTQTSMISALKVNMAGIQLRYDPSRLEVVVDSIEVSIRATTVLGASRPSSPLAVTLYPEPFSAYLNAIGDVRYDDVREEVSPSVNLFGSANLNGVVLEFEGGYDESAAGSGLYRRAARLVYDDEDAGRRFTAGDVSLENLQLVGGVFLGGISVQSGRQVFNPFDRAYNDLSQQLLIERPTMVEVVSNGVVVDTLELNTGSYDLSRLPYQYGSNDLRLVIADEFGRRALNDVDLFYDPFDLAAGETEYSLAVGKPVENFAFEPSYQDNFVFSGHYRRGLSNRTIAGIGLQASEDIQVASLEGRYSPRNFPGSVELAVAASAGESEGLAARLGVFYSDPTSPSGRQFSVSANYESDGFRTLADSQAFGGFESLAVNASYSQLIAGDITAVAGITAIRRDRFADEQTAFVDFLRDFTNGVRVRGGLEFGSGGIYDNSFGLRLGLSLVLGEKHNGSASYNSRRDTAAVSVSRSTDDHVGSWGYDLGARASDATASVDGRLNYVGNRFEGRLGYTGIGDSFSQVGDVNTLSAQIGSAIAFAGGHFAIGRPISDSFVIAKPHSSLRAEQVVIGDRLAGNERSAESGFFGPALEANLYSYNRQSIVYDLKDAPLGTNIGTGIDTVRPAYRSGYVLEVGSDANVSAVGVLEVNGEPARLITGRILGIDDEKFEAQPFFTNSVGRFAVMGMRPGFSYKVELSGQPDGFVLEAPDDGTKLMRLNTISVKVEE